MQNFYFVFLTIIVLLISLPQFQASDEVSLNVINNSGKNINIFWLSFEGKLVQQSNTFIRNGTKFKISSYKTHKFVLLEDKEEYHPFKSAQLEIPPYEVKCYVNKKENNKNSNIGKLRVDCSTELSRNLNKLSQSITSCRENLEDKDNDNEEVDNEDLFTTCIDTSWKKQKSVKMNQRNTFVELRDRMTSSMMKYYCSSDFSSELTTFSTISINSKNYQINQLHQSKHVRIWLVKDYVSTNECDRLIDEVEDDLISVSEYTKASDNRFASGRSLFFDNEGEYDTQIYNTYERLHELVKTLTGYKMNIEGQEGISVIRYKDGDEYKLHCDGPCGNSESNKELRTGARIATAITYCRVPKKDNGGELVFPNIDLKIPLIERMTVVFSYADGISGIDQEHNTDSDSDLVLRGTQDPNGFTKHAGCPVIDDEKWIFTTWWRHGMTGDGEREWKNFDAHGNRLLKSLK